MKKQYMPLWITFIAIGCAVFMIGVLLMAWTHTEYIPTGTKYFDTDGDGYFDDYTTSYKQETNFPYVIPGFFVLIIGSFLAAVGVAVTWDAHKSKEEPPASQPEPQPKVSQVVRAAYNLGIDTSGKSEDELMDEILKRES